MVLGAEGGVSELGNVCFSVDGRDYLWADVIAWATWTGGWVRLRQDVEDAISRTADATLRGALPTGMAVRQAARDFRYQRGLIAAEDLEAWFAQWGVTSAELARWLRHQLLSGGQGIALSVTRDNAFAKTVDSLMWPTAVFSGLLADWADELATRVATRAALVGQPIVGQLAEDTCSALDSAYHDYCDSVATSAAIEKSIAANQQEWTILQYTWVAFASVEAAHEGLLWMSSDGSPISTVAELAGSRLRQATTFAEELDPQLRQRLVSASPGEVLGPLSVGDEPCLILVAAKDPPTSHDPAMRARARAAVVKHAVQGVVDAMVRWTHEL